ncbi:hypothetical protein [Bradyrhizobium glycinis]|uniref:hypothetical protein n=1 Tax=Bradyrhizobium glycinis TaxID=2751812 RepID=UPI0018D5F9AC|nr:hypothetical protein [Bradyrhizobium glycinis]MBH5370579.1 hypothetical protein [Bradyrhizobium glycinis]
MSIKPAAAHDDEIDFKVDQFTRQCRKPFDVQVRSSNLYEHVLTIDVAEFAQSLIKGF